MGSEGVGEAKRAGEGRTPEGKERKRKKEHVGKRKGKGNERKEGGEERGERGRREEDEQEALTGCVRQDERVSS